MAGNAAMTIFIGGDNSDFLKKWESTKRALRKGLGADALEASDSIVTGLAAATAALAAFGIASIKLAGDMQASRKALTTLLGDSKAAEKMLADLASFAADTPFELTGLLTSTKKLLAFGFAAQDVIPMLAAIGDAAAMLGIGQEGISRLTNAIGQMQAKGKVSAEEMMQLAEAGVPAWRFLAEAIGKDIPTAMKLAEQGAIDSTTGINAVLMGMQAKFQGGMAAISKTIPGLMSTIKDNVTMVMVEIGDSIVNSLNLTEKLQGIADWLTEFADAVKTLGLKEALQGLIPPEAIAAVFILAGALVGAAIPAMVAFGMSVWTAMAPLLPFIAIGAAVGLLAYEIWNNWEPLSELFNILWTDITDLFSEAWNTIAALANEGASVIADAWSAIESFTAEAWNSIVAAIVGAWDWIVGIVDDAINFVTQFIGDGWNAVGEGTAAVWSAIVGFIDSAWMGIKEIVAQGINWIVDKMSPLKDFFTQFVPDSMGSWFDQIVADVGEIGSVLGKLNWGFTGLDISSRLSTAAKPNTKFTGLTNAAPAASTPTGGSKGGHAENDFDKLQKKAEQTSKAIEKEWLELTASQMDALDSWYADELSVLNESKSANENYQRDLLRLNEIYAAKKSKIALDQQKDNNRIIDQAVDMARSVTDRINAINVTGIDKQKLDINSDAARQIDDLRKKYRDLTLEYAAGTKAQQEQFRKAWQENGLQFIQGETDKVDFSRQIAAEQIAIEAEKSQKLQDLHYERIKLQEDMDRAREEGDLNRFAELLGKEQALTEQSLTGRQQVMDSYYKIWQETHRDAMSRMAELTDGLYSGFSNFFSDILSGTKSIGDAFQDLGQSVLKIINDMIARWLAARMMMGIFGSSFEGLSGSNFIPAFAAGGSYSGGLALVGEKGPELIDFNRRGYVYNAKNTKQLLKSGDNYHQISVPVNISGETNPKLAGRLRTEIRELVQKIIYEEARL